MWPRAETMMAMERPWARAIPSRPTPPELCRKRSAQMEPAPKKMRAKVPINSAVNFWKVVYMAGGLYFKKGESEEEFERRRVQECGGLKTGLGEKRWREVTHFLAWRLTKKRVSCRFVQYGMVS